MLLATWFKEVTMKSQFFYTVEATRKRFLGTFGRRPLLLPVLAMVVSPTAAPAQSGQTATSDQQTLQALVQRIDQLEARVRQLEAAQHQPTAAPVGAEPAVQQPTPAPGSAPAQAPATQPKPATSLTESAQTSAPQEQAEPAPAQSR